MDNTEHIREIYRAVVADGGVNKTQFSEAVGSVVDQIRPLVESGAVIPDLYTWVRSVVASVDKADGAKADDVLAAIARGEDDLTTDGMPYLDFVVTLGRGGRKVYRFLTASDLDEMDELRHRNVKAVNRSYRDEWKPQYDAWRKVLRRNVTIGNAVESGDLPQIDLALFEAG